MIESFTPDFDAIVSAVLALDVSPMAKEVGSNLVEHWIANDVVSEDDTILAVECGFTLWLDDRTLAIGVQDLITGDGDRITGHEWKTSSESKNWGETKWLQELVCGPQLGIYALALNQADYYEGDGKMFNFSVPRPRIHVRAIVKKEPPKFWPSDPDESVWEFSDEKLKTVKDAFLARAEMIRSLRKSKLLPWNLQGGHCFAFGRTCEYFDKHCGSSNHPASDFAAIAFDENDPAYQASLAHISKDRLTDPDLVILSASAYKTGSSCLEQYRIQSSVPDAKKETSMALEIGTVLHAGVAAYYRQRQSHNTVR